MKRNQQIILMAAEFAACGLALTEGETIDYTWITAMQLGLCFWERHEDTVGEIEAIHFC